MHTGLWGAFNHKNQAQEIWTTQKHRFAIQMNAHKSLINFSRAPDGHNLGIWDRTWFWETQTNITAGDSWIVSVAIDPLC